MMEISKYGFFDLGKFDGARIAAQVVSAKGQSTFADKLIPLFTEEEAGSEIYSRRDEEWQERCYTRAEVEEKLKAAGFEICGVFGNTKFKRAAKSDSKMYFAARAKKSVPLQSPSSLRFCLSAPAV